MVGNKHWSDDEKKILRDHFPYISSPELAKALGGRTTRAVDGQAMRNGLRKVPERIAEMARENLGKPKRADPGSGNPLKRP